MTRRRLLSIDRRRLAGWTSERAYPEKAPRVLGHHVLPSRRLPSSVVPPQDGERLSHDSPPYRYYQTHGDVCPCSLVIQARDSLLSAFGGTGGEGLPLPSPALRVVTRGSCGASSSPSGVFFCPSDSTCPVDWMKGVREDGEKNGPKEGEEEEEEERRWRSMTRSRGRRKGETMATGEKISPDDARKEGERSGREGEREQREGDKQTERKGGEGKKRAGGEEEEEGGSRVRSRSSLSEVEQGVKSRQGEGNEGGVGYGREMNEDSSKSSVSLSSWSRHQRETEEVESEEGQEAPTLLGQRGNLLLSHPQQQCCYSRRNPERRQENLHALVARGKRGPSSSPSLPLQQPQSLKSLDSSQWSDRTTSPLPDEPPANRSQGEELLFGAGGIEASRGEGGGQERVASPLPVGLSVQGHADLQGQGKEIPGVYETKKKPGDETGRDERLCGAFPNHFWYAGGEGEGCYLPLALVSAWREHSKVSPFCAPGALMEGQRRETTKHGEEVEQPPLRMGCGPPRLPDTGASATVGHDRETARLGNGKGEQDDSGTRRRRGGGGDGGSGKEDETWTRPELRSLPTASSIATSASSAAAAGAVKGSSCPSVSPTTTTTTSAATAIHHIRHPPAHSLFSAPRKTSGELLLPISPSSTAAVLNSVPSSSRLLLPHPPFLMRGGIQGENAALFFHGFSSAEGPLEGLSVRATPRQAAPREGEGELAQAACCSRDDDVRPAVRKTNGQQVAVVVEEEGERGRRRRDLQTTQELYLQKFQPVEEGATSLPHDTTAAAASTAWCSSTRRRLPPHQTGRNRPASAAAPLPTYRNAPEVSASIQQPRERQHGGTSTASAAPSLPLPASPPVSARGRQRTEVHSTIHPTRAGEVFLGGLNSDAGGDVFCSSASPQTQKNPQMVFPPQHPRLPYRSGVASPSLTSMGHIQSLGLSPRACGDQVYIHHPATTAGQHKRYPQQTCQHQQISHDVENPLLPTPGEALASAKDHQSPTALLTSRPGWRAQEKSKSRREEVEEKREEFYQRNSSFLAQEQGGGRRRDDGNESLSLTHRNKANALSSSSSLSPSEAATPFASASRSEPGGPHSATFLLQTSAGLAPQDVSPRPLSSAGEEKEEREQPTRLQQDGQGCPQGAGGDLFIRATPRSASSSSSSSSSSIATKEEFEEKLRAYKEQVNERKRGGGMAKTGLSVAKKEKSLLTGRSRLLDTPVSSGSRRKDGPSSFFPEGQEDGKAQVSSESQRATVMARPKGMVISARVSPSSLQSPHTPHKRSSLPPPLPAPPPPSSSALRVGGGARGGVAL